MSDANLTSLFFAKETAFAETPDLGSTLQEIRFVSESIVHAKNTVLSEEIRSDRARADLIQVGVSAEGSIECEAIVEAYNQLILSALLGGAWVTSNDAVTASSSAAGQTITATVGTFSTQTQGAKFVKIAGFVNSGNNGIFEVVSASSTVLTLAAGSLTGGDETGVAITAVTKYARNGVTLDSFLVEKRFAGITPAHYVAMIGGVINEMSLSLEAQALATLSFGWMGARLLESSATFGDGSPLAVNANPIINTTNNIGSLKWDGAAFAANVMAVEMTLNNNLRDRPAVSRLFTLEHGRGSIDLTGNVNCYFEDATLLTSFLAHDAADLLLPIWDANGNLMSVHLPQIKFSGGSPQADGINTDVMLDLEFTALLDQTLDYVIQIDQVNAA